MSKLESESVDWPPGVRRDEIDRTGVLSRSAILSFGLAFLSFFLPVAALISLPLGVAVCRAARHDLQKMLAGVIDARNEAAMRKAMERAISAIVLSSIALLLWTEIAFGMLATGGYKVFS